MAGKKGGAGQKPSGGGTSKKGGKERKMISDYKETASTSQPNAMDTMRPTAGGWVGVNIGVRRPPFFLTCPLNCSFTGVTLRSGTQSKAGPQKPRDKDRDSAVGLTMTRDEFQRHVAARCEIGVVWLTGL